MRDLSHDRGARGRYRRLGFATAAAFGGALFLAACEPKTTPSPTAAFDAGHAAATIGSAAAHVAADASVDEIDTPADAGPPFDMEDALRDAPVAERLAGNILVAGRVMETLTALVDAMPSRVSGSKGHEAAADWAVDAFKKAQIASARVEPFTIAHGWERRDASASIVAPFDRALHVTAAGWFPPTPAEGIRGEIVHPNEITPDAVKKIAASLKRKIVLLDKTNRTKGWPTALDALRDAGVVALVGSASGAFPDQAPFAHSAWFYHDLVGPLPMVDLGSEDDFLLLRQMEKGPVTVHITNVSPLSPPVRVPNVIAEIRGRERPDEWVLLGAHLDGWDLGAGAQDDGTGVAEVLEAARGIQALGVAPRRSIRFALFGGEEQGSLGSRAYADAHARELDRAALVIISDAGGGAPKGFVTGRGDLTTAMAPIAALLGGLGGASIASAVACGSDDCPFAVLGVPAISLDCDDSKYDDIHHRMGDTLDKVSPANVAQAAAILAIAAWTAAELPDRIAPRSSRAEVSDRFKKAGLLDGLVFQGVWPDHAP